MRARILFLAILLLCFLAVGLPALAQIPPVRDKLKPPSGPGCSLESVCAEVAPDMIKSALGDSPLEQNLRYLTDVIGGRMTGSAAADHAVDWAVQAFRFAGVDEVHTEKFTVPVKWSEGATRLDVLSPDPFPVRLVSIGWSPGTPEGGVTADVVDVGQGDDAGFAHAGSAARGAILLVHSGAFATWEDLDNEYTLRRAILQRVIQSGAAAVLWTSTRPHLLLYRHNISTDGQLEPLPQAIVAREDAERMARLLTAGVKLRVHLLIPNHVAGPFESENVVAEIRGRDKPEEFVMLGAHLDSWDLGTGALDNGCNAALMIDVARVIRASGIVPRRSIRFVLFTGEEQGELGSWAYAKAHREELDNLVAVIVYDAGNGRVTGYSLGGRKDVLDAVNQVLKPAKPLGPLVQTTDVQSGSDHDEFMLQGVPTLFANQQPANYMPNYHAASDTFDKVDIAELKHHVALAAITAFGIADAPARIGKRQSRAEIEALLKETGLDREMQATGLWADWLSGARGRKP
jgi:Iap family predicted aminopeptidase